MARKLRARRAVIPVNPTRISVSRILFLEIVENGVYDLWLPFHCHYKVGSIVSVHEHPLGVSVEMVCVNIKRSKERINQFFNEDHFTVTFKAVNGPIKLDRRML